MPSCDSPASPPPKTSWPGPPPGWPLQWGADRRGQPRRRRALRHRPGPLRIDVGRRLRVPPGHRVRRGRAARARRRAGLQNSLGWAGGPGGAGDHLAVALRHHDARRAHQRPRLRRTGPPGTLGATAFRSVDRRLTRPRLPRPRRHGCVRVGRAHPGRSHCTAEGGPAISPSAPPNRPTPRRPMRSTPRARRFAPAGSARTPVGHQGRRP